MHKQTRAKAIPKAVKDIVWERDNGQCIICGTTHSAPEAHYISRAQGGLGIEENIVTLCRTCHAKYDQTLYRKAYKLIIGTYLREHYPDWNEDELVYKKHGG